MLHAPERPKGWTAWWQRCERIMLERDVRIASSGSRRRSVMLECIRRLHPVRQWDGGIGFFQYLAAVIASGTDACLWTLRRPGAMNGLALSVVLWLCVLEGTWLTIVPDVESTTVTVPEDLQHPNGQDREHGCSVTGEDGRSASQGRFAGPQVGCRQKDDQHGRSGTTCGRNLGSSKKDA
jgi:hypothetical protein